MNKKRRLIIFSIFLFLAVLYALYPFLDTKVQGFLIENNSEYARIERVIDGDTVVINGSSARLLGINSPEKGEDYYNEAKSFLENLALNKTLKSESRGFDLYNRKLVYLFDGNKNINLEIVKEGFANFYFPSGKDMYYNDFAEAWENCIEENKNLCEKSLDECAECVFLKEFDYKNQKVIFENSCSFDCDLTGWEIKDEGRKKFVFGNFVLGSGEETEITEKDFNETYVWTSSGDTLFLRDNEGKLVLWERY